MKIELEVIEKELEKLVGEGVLKKIDCFDCPKRKGNYCHFYLTSTQLAKQFCTICMTCKNANWLNDFYKECLGCILGHEKTKELNMGREEDEGIYPEETYMGEDEDEIEASEVFVYVCDKCGETLDLEIDCEFAKIPFEGTWACKCGNVIKVKWDGKELKYL